jgi:hypothetical protein
MSDVADYYEAVLHQTAAIASSEGSERVQAHLQRHGFDGGSAEYIGEAYIEIDGERFVLSDVDITITAGDDDR